MHLVRSTGRAELLQLEGFLLAPRLAAGLGRPVVARTALAANERDGRPISHGDRLPRPLLLTPRRSS